ncbi:hypothetical protein A5647_15235 [Mycobacterium sp. 1100029.7]|nr:hypothetical protein A5647_15235 [Mycobacterium sp. 1100029.7]
MAHKMLIRLMFLALICTLFCLAPAAAWANVVDNDHTLAATQQAPAHPHSDPHRRQPIREDASGPARRSADRQPRGGYGKQPAPRRTRS